MKNRINIKHFEQTSLILLLLMLMFGSNVFSQEVTQTEEITVVAPYQPSVSDAYKINVSPKIPDESVEKPKFNY